MRPALGLVVLLIGHFMGRNDQDSCGTCFVLASSAFAEDMAQAWPLLLPARLVRNQTLSGCAIARAGMIKVVGIVVLSALFLGESSIFTTRQANTVASGIILHDTYLLSQIASQDCSYLHMAKV